MKNDGYEMLIQEGHDRRTELKVKNDRLRENVAALQKELAYWRAVVEDPGIYWGNDNPPYRLDDD